MKELKKVLIELYKFSTEVLTLNNPIQDKSLIECFEEKFGIILPTDFKEFLCIHNGIDLMGDCIYGLSGTENLENVYEFEHNHVVIPQYKYLVPFSPDGGGNFYCFDTRIHNQNSCPVIFWASNYLYSNEDQPEVVNTTFLSWFREVVIEWTEESYDFDGNEK